MTETPNDILGGFEAWWLTTKLKGYTDRSLAYMFAKAAWQGALITAGILPRWRIIEQAPRDGSIVRLRVGEMTFLAAWQDGFLDSNEEPCGMWVAQVEGHHPQCWHDGCCWGSNADEEPSEYPTHFLLITSPPQNKEISDE